MEIKRYNQFINEELKPYTYRSAAAKLQRRGFTKRSKDLQDWANKQSIKDKHIFNIYFELDHKRQIVKQVDEIVKGYFINFNPLVDLFIDSYEDGCGSYVLTFQTIFQLIDPPYSVVDSNDIYIDNTVVTSNITIELVEKDGELTVSDKYFIEGSWVNNHLSLPSNRKDAVELKKRMVDTFVPGSSEFDMLFDFFFEKGIMHKDELMKVNKVLKSININDLWYTSQEAERKFAEKEKISPINTTGNVNPIYKYKE